MDRMCYTKIMHRVSDADWFMWVSVREKDESVHRRCCQVHLIHSHTHTHAEVNKISWHLHSHHIWILSSWVHCDRLQLGQALPGLCSAFPIGGHHLIWHGRAQARPVITSGRVTNHITSTDSLQSLCSLDAVLRLCPYLSEWRFMLWPVGGRVMWYKSSPSEAEGVCATMWSVRLTLAGLRAAQMFAGRLLPLAWLSSGNGAEARRFL